MAGSASMSWLWPHDNRNVAELNIPGGAVEPLLTAVAAALHEVRKRRRIRANNFKRRALGFGHVGLYPNRLDWYALFGLFVVAHGERATRQRGQELHALHDTPHEGDVAIQVPRRVADDHVKLCPTAAIDVVVASGT